ncbi:MAG: PAS domain S-box protein, partial [Candidatus Heimdallarchaeaceae archaeon]
MLSVDNQILENNLTRSKQKKKLITALHIDDDEAFLDISKIFIEKISNGNITVESLSTPTKVLEKLDLNDYDIVISDYQMPRINGIELLQKIRRSGCKTPFIILTGKGREEVAIHALNLGADYYLKKGSDAKSQFTELIHIINKITHLKDIEKALFESETRFRELVEKTNDGLIIQNQKGIFTYVNNKFCEILGYTKNELLGKKAVTFMTEKSKIDFLEKNKIHETNNGEPYDLSWRKKDNQIIYTSISSESLKDKDNGFSGSFNVITDITQRILDEQRIRSLNSILRAIRNVNQLITKENNQESLLQGVCDILVNVRGFYNACIFLFDDNNKIITSVNSGEARDIDIMAEKLRSHQLEGNCREALELNNILSIPAVCNECIGCQMNNNSKNREVLVSSLIHNEENYGYLTISLSPEFIDDDAEIQLFQELSDDVAFALYKLNLQKQNIETQKELKKEKEKLKQYLEIAEIIFLVIDSNEKISLINKKGCEILECEEEDIIGKNWFDEFIPEAEREEVRGIFGSLMREEREPLEFFENQIITPGGKKKLIAWNNTFLKDNEGNITSTLSSGEDITQKKQIEKALIESEELYRNLVEISPDSIILCDLKGRIVFANKQTAVMNGADDVDDIIGENIFKYFAYYDLKNALEHVKTVIETGKSKNSEYSLSRKDGTFLPVEISSSLIRDNENKPLSMLSVMRDISIRKKVEQQTKEREENYYSLFNQMSDAFAYYKMIYDENNDPLDVVFLNVNSNFEKFTGLREKDIIGSKMSDVFSDILSQTPNLIERFGHVAKTGNSTNFELFF